MYEKITEKLGATPWEMLLENTRLLGTLGASQKKKYLTALGILNTRSIQIRSLLGNKCYDGRYILFL